MHITLNKIKETSGLFNRKLLNGLLKTLGKTQPDDEPLAIVTILDSHGIGEALWCLGMVSGEDKKLRLYAVSCARDVQHLMKDKRSVNAIDIAEKFANGTATKKELHAAEAQARDAAMEAARDMKWDKSYDVAMDVASWPCAPAAYSTAVNAAEIADVSDKQEKELRRICGDLSAVKINTAGAPKPKP